MKFKKKSTILRMPQTQLKHLFNAAKSQGVFLIRIK